MQCLEEKKEANYLFYTATKVRTNSFPIDTKLSLEQAKGKKYTAKLFMRVVEPDALVYGGKKIAKRGNSKGM